MGVAGPRRPLPAPLVEHRAALWADRRLGQLEARLVGVVDVLVDQPIAPGLPGNLALVLHLTLPANVKPWPDGSMADVALGGIDVSQSLIRGGRH